MIVDEWRYQEARSRHFYARAWGVIVFVLALFWTGVYFFAEGYL